MTESATPRNLTPNEDGEMVCRTCGGHDGHFDDCPTTWTDADLTPEELADEDRYQSGPEDFEAVNAEYDYYRQVEQDIADIEFGNLPDHLDEPGEDWLSAKRRESGVQLPLLVRN